MEEVSWSSTEAELYFKTGTPTEILPLQDLLTKEVEEKYPLAVISFSPPETIFEKLFVTGEADIVAELHAPINKSSRSRAITAVGKERYSGNGNDSDGYCFP